MKERSLGILGGGQLAQMLALAAIPLGVRVRVLEPDQHAPAHLCAEHRAAPYTDSESLAWLAQCDAVTLEFENVPIAALEQLEGKVPVRPAGELLQRSKHRAREKKSLLAAGVTTAPFLEIESDAHLAGALDVVGGCGILKTSELGYDGKGQVKVSSEAELQTAWHTLGEVACVLEGIVPFSREVSLAVARNPSGEIAFGPLVENVHRNGILRTSIARLDDEATATARHIAQKIAVAWELEGLLTLEFFQLDSGELLVNEVAPRVHNSGHLTQDGGGYSQFEMQVRAVLDMPLHNFSPLLPAAMVNIIGSETAPDWNAIKRIEGAQIHLYHKAHRIGRKLGHVNVIAADQALLNERLAEVEALIPE